MYHDKCWENFAITHDVKLYNFVDFKYECDDVLTVKVFDGTMCRKYYYTDEENSNNDDEDTDDDDVKPSI